MKLLFICVNQKCNFYFQKYDILVIFVDFYAMIWIREAKMKQIRPDPDPHHWKRHSKNSWYSVGCLLQAKICRSDLLPKSSFLHLSYKILWFQDEIFADAETFLSFNGPSAPDDDITDNVETVETVEVDDEVQISETEKVLSSCNLRGGFIRGICA